MGVGNDYYCNIFRRTNKLKYMDDTKRIELGIIPLYETFTCADDESLAQLESLIKRSLPAEYREFLKKYGKSCFEKEVIYPCTPSPWIPDGFGSMSCFYGMGTGHNDVMKEFTRFDSYNPTERLLPIGHDAFGNVIGLDLSDSDYGKIHFWDHESAKRYLIAKSFREFIDSFVVQSDG